MKALPTRQTLEAYGARFPKMDVAIVEEALFMLRRASILMRELEAYFAQSGLSQSRFLILIVLDRESESQGLRASEIADRLDVSRSVVSETLKGLRRAGWIEFDSVKSDRGARLVTLTNAGRSKLTDVLPGYYDVIQKRMTANS